VYLLDTNVLGQVLRKRPRQTVMEKLRQIPSDAVQASIVTLFEMHYGSMLRDDADPFWLRIQTQIVPLVRWIPVDEAIAMQAGDAAASLKKIGRPIGLADCLIAASASVHGLTLITENIRHFERIEQLRCETW
jgi:tRNA(fMet)-specific endonuclease VapC